ncbi:MAG: NepR family anti-sigma factor [Methyloceanibacter sp.]
MDGSTNKKDRRRKMPGASKKMDQVAQSGVRKSSGGPRGTEMDEGLSPNLQAHIGRHVRAAFDEVAREPVPDHLLRLLKDLERSGDK